MPRNELTVTKLDPKVPIAFHPVTASGTTIGAQGFVKAPRPDKLLIQAIYTGGGVGPSVVITVAPQIATRPGDARWPAWTVPTISGLCDDNDQSPVMIGPFPSCYVNSAGQIEFDVSDDTANMQFRAWELP